MHCSYELFVCPENYIHEEHDYGEQCDIAGIPMQPTSENSGMIDEWLRGFLFCCTDADIPSSDENIRNARCGTQTVAFAYA